MNEISRLVVGELGGMRAKRSKTLYSYFWFSKDPFGALWEPGGFGWGTLGLTHANTLSCS